MYRLGTRSRERLEGVHPHLVRVVEEAIRITPVDFTVLEGVRDVERQKDLVASGASQTMRSRHLTGHAVDLGAWVGGQVSWDWPLYYRIAEAMRQASIEAGVPVEWGAAWGRDLRAYISAEEASDDYTGERRSQGRRPFLDGPHYQLPWVQYPANQEA